jgi:Uma2 family endonuclease
MGAGAERMTVDDYYAITVEGDRRQLVDGRVVVNEPRVTHALLQGRILEALRAWAGEGAGNGVALPPTDVRIDDRNLFGPDVVWIAEAHRPRLGTERLARVPDICVEIRSPGTWRHDVGPKREAYERGGCPELWLVDDRARAVHVHRRSRPGSPRFDVIVDLGPGATLTSPQLPGFGLPLERLFSED